MVTPVVVSGVVIAVGADILRWRERCCNPTTELETSDHDTWTMRTLDDLGVLEWRESACVDAAEQPTDTDLGEGVHVDGVLGAYMAQFQLAPKVGGDLNGRTCSCPWAQSTASSRRCNSSISSPIIVRADACAILSTIVQ